MAEPMLWVENGQPACTAFCRQMFTWKKHPEAIWGNAKEMQKFAIHGKIKPVPI